MLGKTLTAFAAESISDSSISYYGVFRERTENLLSKAGDCVAQKRAVR